MNRRVAAHLNRKAPLTGEPQAAPDNRPSPSSRAAQAAARVAARYAKAPSYSEVLANEARAAMAAAEAASRAAMEAHAAAQSVLNSLEAAASEESYRAADSRPFPADARHAHELSAGSGSEQTAPLRSRPVRRDADAHQAIAEEPLAIRWQPDLQMHRAEPASAHLGHASELFDSHAFDSHADDWPEHFAEIQEMQEFATVEPAQPIHANLIEFPRELVAARKMRPRLAEGPLAAEETGSQLSIFEVDPGTISIEPEPVPTPQATVAANWTGPEWSGIRLDPQPESELAGEVEPEAANGPQVQPASANRRVLAAAVDMALVAGVVLGVAMTVVAKTAALPSLRTIELWTLLGMLVVGALYQVGFLSFAKATPGMLYAQIRLCTLEGEAPTRRQRNARLVAMLLSVLPIGFGIVWAIFDDDHLTWHDRLSQTYLRLR